MYNYPYESRDLRASASPRGHARSRRPRHRDGAFFVVQSDGRDTRTWGSWLMLARVASEGDDVTMAVVRRPREESDTAVMLSLTYISTAATPFDTEQMAALLLQSRENNDRHGLTGMLLYKEGRFMQVLEGSSEEVRERYAVISADPRHTGVRTLLDESIDQRRFGQWSMGVPDVADDDLRRAPGYDAFFETPPRRREGWEDPSRAQLLLDWFRLRG